MTESVYALDSMRRGIVLDGLREACSQRGWFLIAAHVRESHVHAVVGDAEDPERVLHDLKAFASRELNRAGIDGERRKRWTRHGSMRALRDRDAIVRAVDYVVTGQGARMAVYVAGDERAPCCRASGDDAAL